MTLDFDAVAVLCSGIVDRGDGHGYVPRDYIEAPERMGNFGVSGGYWRCVAAALLYQQNRTDRFVFSSGRGRRALAKHGPSCPTGASVHQHAFLGYLESAGGPAKPTTILEEKSCDTRTNILQIGEIVEAAGWAHVGLLSSSWHLPRIMMLCADYAPYLLDRVTFLSAEMIIARHEEHTGTDILPDEDLARVERSPQYETRMAYELQGVLDVLRGNYAVNPLWQPE